MKHDIFLTKKRLRAYRLIERGRRLKKLISVCIGASLAFITLALSFGWLTMLSASLE